MFPPGNSFSSQVDDFLGDEWTTTGVEKVGAQVVQSAVDVGQIRGPHMFYGINAEASDSQANQVVHEIHDTVSDPRDGLVQVGQTNQIAIPHLGRLG